jgi:hypothetical protein
VYSAAVEKARLEALKRGHSVAEQTLSDGSVVLTVTAMHYPYLPGPDSHVIISTP